MADPLSITAVFAFLNSAVKFSELAVKLYSVDSENGVFVRMIQTVRQDLEETERLLSVPSVRAQLISTPAKLPWIKGVIISTKSALNEIGRWVERVRGDKEGFGSVTLENRMRWVFNDHDKLVNRRMELGSSHQALSTVLMYLSPLEQAVVATTGEPPEYQDATFLDAYISPTQRRKHIRMSQKSSMQLRKDETISDAAAYQPRTVNNITDPIFRKEEGVGGEGLPMIPTGNTTGAEGTLNLTQPHNLYPDSKLDMTLKGEKSSSACGSADIVPTSTTSSSFLQNSNLTSGQQSNSPLTTVQAEYPTSITTPTATSNYPQPWSQRQESFSLSSQGFGSVSAPWVSDRQSPLGEEIHRSSLPALPPKIPVETLKHRFSATSFGPVDPFGFTCEVESNGLSSFDGDPKDRNSAKSAAETKDNNPFDVPHTVSSEPRAELPAIPPNVQSAYLHSTTTAELPAWSQARPPWSELPGCSILPKPSSTRQEKAQQNLYNNSLQYTFPARPQSDAFRNRASSYTMTRSELPETGTSSPPRTRTMNSLTSPSASLASITAPQLPRPQSEYQPYRVPQPIPEAQVQIQPAPIYQYQSPNQYPYQNYQTLSSEAPTSRPVSVASTLPPYPMDFRDQRLGYSTPVSPEVQPVLPDLGAQESQSTERTLTLREARRRNQKVLLDIMSSESSG